MNNKMARSSLVQWIKCMLSLLVVLLWMLSLGLLYVCCWIRDNFSRIALVTEGTTVGDFYLVTFFPVIFPILITVSCFLLVIGCLGCCGALTENQLLLGWFFFSILLTFCIELSAGIWKFVDWNLTYSDDDIEKLTLNANKYGRLEQYGWFARAWTEIHTKFHCCGVSSSEDWDESPHIQASCCFSGNNLECLANLKKMEFIGCGRPLMEFLTGPSPLQAIPYLTTMIGTVQIICLILTLKLWLIMCFRKQQKVDTNEASKIKTPANRYSCHKTQYSCKEFLEFQRSRGCSQNVTSDTPMKELSDNEYVKYASCADVDESGTINYCPQCLLNTYEEMQLLPMTTFERDYFRQGLLQNPPPSKVMTSNRCSENYQQTTNSLGAVARRNYSVPKMVTTFPSNSTMGDFEIKRSASSQLPVSYRFPSNGSVYPYPHVSHSAGLPRKKYTHYTPRQRRRILTNGTRRLSTIRASGVCATSDLSLNWAASENIIFDENRRYNTEVSTSAEASDARPTSKLYSSVPEALINTGVFSVGCEIDIENDNNAGNGFEPETPRNSVSTYPTL